MQIRYYNPEWGRFVNADGIVGIKGELLGHNLFAYCKNNPINMLDDAGNWPKWLENINVSNALTVASGVLCVIAGVSIGAVNPFLGALIGAHGINQIASGLTNDRINWEKSVLGDEGYLAYDTAIGLTTMKASVNDLIENGIKNTYVKITTTVTRRGKGYVATTIDVNLRWGKVSYDALDYGLGANSLVSNTKQAGMYLMPKKNIISGSSRGVNFTMSY